jgi:hypothetical protein
MPTLFLPWLGARKDETAFRSVRNVKMAESSLAGNGFGVFDYRLLVRSYWNQAEQQTEKRKKWTHYICFKRGLKMDCSFFLP